MSNFPEPRALAELVSNITNTMFGMSFSLAGEDSLDPSGEPPWQTARLPLTGKRNITVTIAADQDGAQTLACAMWGLSPSDVDLSMQNDSLGELANIVAGQIKTVMGVDQSLGLPECGPFDPSREQDKGSNWRSATLRNNMKEVRVWVGISEIGTS